MKKLLLTLGLAVITQLGAMAQGTIQFANNAGTRFTVDGVRPLNASLGGPAAGTYNFGVFVGLSADSISDVPAGPLGHNTATGGLITAPNPNVYQIAGFAPGEAVFLMFRGWGAEYGSDWQAARRNLSYGESTIIRCVLAGELGPGTVIWRRPAPDSLQCFDIRVSLTQYDASCVPEPSTVVLVGFGLGSVLLVGRRRGNSKH